MYRKILSVFTKYAIQNYRHSAALPAHCIQIRSDNGDCAFMRTYGGTSNSPNLDRICSCCVWTHTKKKTDVWPLCIIMFVLLNASNAIQWLQPIQNALKTTMRKKFQSCREQKKSELVWRSSSMQWAKKSFHWVCWSSDANVCSKNPRLRGTWLVHSSAFLQWAK